MDCYFAQSLSTVCEWAEQSDLGLASKSLSIMLSTARRCAVRSCCGLIRNSALNLDQRRCASGLEQKIANRVTQVLWDYPDSLLRPIGDEATGIIEDSDQTFRAIQQLKTPVERIR